MLLRCELLLLRYELLLLPLLWLLLLLLLLVRYEHKRGHVEVQPMAPKRFCLRTASRD